MKGLVELFKKRNNAATSKGAGEKSEGGRTFHFHHHQQQQDFEDERSNHFSNNTKMKKKKHSKGQGRHRYTSNESHHDVSYRGGRRLASAMHLKNRYNDEVVNSYNSYEDDYEDNDKSSSLFSSSLSRLSSSLSSTASNSDNLKHVYPYLNETKKRDHYKGKNTPTSSSRKRKKKKEKFNHRNNDNKYNQPKQEQDIELLTREELYELPARELRKKCHLLGLDASRVVEKEGLVLLLHEFYRRQSAERHNHRHHHEVSISPLMQIHSTGRSTNIVQQPTFNDENEQMTDILFEIIPYYGQGDPSIDPIVKDTIQRLPFYCLESRDKSAGNTLIMLACQVGALDLVLMLLSKGSDVNAQNWNGETCLHFVCYSDSYSPDIAKVLINNGAKPEVAENRFGCTPLHWVASIGDIELCKILCASGAKATTIDKSGFDPIAYSKQCQKEECTNFLVSACPPEESVTCTNQFSGDTAMQEWQKLLDESTGYFYFHNRKTGESMWEDDFIIYKQSLANGGLRPTASSFFNRPQPPSTSPKSEATDEQLDVNAQGKEATKIKEFHYSEDKESDMEEVKRLEIKKISFSHIDPNELKQILSDSDISSSNSSMREYEEEVLETDQKQGVADDEDTDQNNSHTKVNVRDRLVTKGSFNLRFKSLQTSMEDQLNKTLKTIEEKIVSSKVNEDIKREESDSLKMTISTLTTKLIQLQTEAGTKDLEIQSLNDKIATMKSTSAPKNESRDAFFGDNDIGEIDKLTSSQQDEITNLQALLKRQSTEMELLKENQARDKEQITQIEAQIQEEKDAKRDVLVLLEQAQQGKKVDDEVSKQLEDEKRRTEDELAKVKTQYKIIENELVEERLSRMQNEMDVKSLQEKHSATLKLSKHLEDEKHQTEDELSRVKAKFRVIEKQLEEEQVAKVQNEMERNEAIQAYQDALARTKTAELEVARMSGMIEEAKTMIRANEMLHRSLHIEIDKRKVLHNQLEDLKGKIRVYVRIRPLSTTEMKTNCREVLVKEDKRTCVMYKNENDSTEQAKSWEFDSVFHGSSSDGNSQEDIFKDTRKLVTSTIDGFNVCIFAYGQTGSGKTYTMFGHSGFEVSSSDTYSLNNSDAGLAPRVAFELFQLVEERKTSFDVKVKMNMFELYNDKIRDLMNHSNDNGNSSSLRVKLAEHSESGLVEVPGALSKNVEDAQQLLQFFKEGSEFRTTASTKMNADSSRSHLITTITVSLTNKRTDHVISGKMTLVDLAGSERVAKSGATGNQLKEAQSINKSLSALGDVINALTTGSRHIPYRNHPLTMLMSDSMGGNAKTLMFVCCSPADYNSGESSNALDFATRCKDVRNNVVTTGELDQVNVLKAQLSRLKKENSEKMKHRVSVAKRPGRK